jgi:2-amino-4-hydroxy-6-hydroxymethyldihydropteridine diphosphokinase
MAYIGLGTNVGDRAANLRAAVALLRERVAEPVLSSVYESEPVGYTDQPAFCNMVARVHTSLDPHELLRTLIAIEEAMGRQRTFRNAPRIIDLDILLYGDVVMHESGLDLPHPRMTERAFVLMPLVELEPELEDPVSGDRFVEILTRGHFERVELLGALESLNK